MPLRDIVLLVGGLSGSENTQIDDTTLVWQRNQAGTFLWKVKAKGESETLTGRVQGIYFEPQDS